MDDRISLDELKGMFGDIIPMEAFKLIAHPSADATVPNIRLRLLEIAAQYKQFKPCALEWRGVGLTQYIHEDVPYVAHPVRHPDGAPGHYMDALLSMDDKRLVGMNFWFLPPKRRTQ